MTNGRPDTRERLSDTRDARAVATRRRLDDAFRQAAEEGIPELTVVKISKLAGVGRSTFYTHYATIAELAVTVIDSLFQDTAVIDAGRRTERSLSRQRITRLSLEALLSRLWKERKLLSYATALPEGTIISREVVKALASSTVLVVQSERADLDEVGVRITADFLAAGMAHVVTEWVEKAEWTQEQMVEVLFKVLPEWLTAS